MTDDRIGRALAVLGATVAQISAIDDEVIREHVEEAYALVRAEYAARQVEQRCHDAAGVPGGVVMLTEAIETARG